MRGPRLAGLGLAMVFVAAMLALPLAVVFVPFAKNLVSAQRATLVLLERGEELAAGLV